MKQIKLKGKDIFDGQRLLGAGKVLILDENGAVAGIVAETAAGDGVQELDGILCPGFVNTHCHLELSHMKGAIPEKTGLPAFLTQVMQSRNNSNGDQAAIIIKAEQDMWDSGIAAVGDICNSTATLAQKQQGKLYYHSFIECIGFVDAGANSRYTYSMETLQAFRDINGPHHQCSIVPHAPYSVSKTLFGMLAATPHNTPVSIHNQECPAENDLYNNKTGAFLDFYSNFGIDISAFKATGSNSLEAYLPIFSTNKMLLVHNTYTTAQDIQFAQQQPLETWWCLCPLANLYIENRLPDINLFRQLKCNITLGTDSLASNHQLSVWEEIKTIRTHFPEIPLEEILQWATFNGAKALGIQDTYGSFNPGSKPGVVLINLDSKRII
ncbi:cytosine/adenosine deaminase-related metal-dependent hydrolase [Chitinophaga niastensis]|uniref:Cytosine/adenosine deaminase-related metal-dependent hydrolase n=1 Tax=Chitinophaga niastensis TaxID=536980 RepID=A0A2P8HTT5_CHINA|nr:amidohydrolase family protein [Chitinophaga niastensis]PSL49636.1 cytosine/adenosine deaminase-related metal-dependent hydrolase [Chitinophaga niastensis]